MDQLIELLYLISSALLVPVIVVLLGFLIWCLLEIGGFLREWQERRRTATHWSLFLAQLDSPRAPDTELADRFFDRADYPGLLGSFARRGRQRYRHAILRGKLVSDLEIEAAGRLAAMNLGVRVGPMLGLMGTLIPLGPALLGLSEENVDMMGRSLVVAFCTTVLGLLVGGVCYAMLLVRRQWYARDLADVEFIDSCLSHSRVPTDARHDPRERTTNSQPSAAAVHGG